jgi:hypothetical protein
VTDQVADRRIAAGLFLLCLLTYAWFDPGPGWTQNANFDLTRAMVERQTLYIDGYHVNTRDVSPGRQGHIFINKPPGMSLLAAIPYVAIVAVEKLMHVPVDDAFVARVNLWLITVFSCGVMGAGIAVAVFWYGRRRAGAGAAFLVALLIGVGTVVVPYSTMLFAQVPSAFFLFLAFVWREERPLLAGLAAGVAGACFYFCIPAAVVLAVFALRHSMRTGVRFILGGVPVAILLAVYQWICFGSPFRTPTEMSAGFTDEKLLFGVMRAPKLEALWGITFSPYRGLFYACPVLLFAFAGAFVMIRRRIHLRDLGASAAITALFLLLVSSYSWWDGAWAFGPRFLLPIVPMLAVPMLFAAHRVRPLWVIAGVLSIAINIAATAVDPMPSQAIRNPIGDYIAPTLITGRLPEPARAALQRESAEVGHVGINPISPWWAMNLGELVFGLGSAWSLLPVGLWVFGGWVGVGRMARRMFSSLTPPARDGGAGRHRASRRDASVPPA